MTVDTHTIALRIRTRGTHEVKLIRLTQGKTTVGRDSQASVIVNDDSVSRLHCEFVRTGDSVVVADLGSGNGTFLKKRPISRPIPLWNGASITIGSTTIKLEGGVQARRPLLLAAVPLCAAGCVIAGVAAWRIFHDAPAKPFLRPAPLSASWETPRQQPAPAVSRQDVRDSADAPDTAVVAHGPRIAPVADSLPRDTTPVRVRKPRSEPTSPERGPARADSQAVRPANDKPSGVQSAKATSPAPRTAPLAVKGSAGGPDTAADGVASRKSPAPPNPKTTATQPKSGESIQSSERAHPAETTGDNEIKPDAAPKPSTPDLGDLEGL